jgi:hypothetical protein
VGGRCDLALSCTTLCGPNTNSVEVVWPGTAVHDSARPAYYFCGARVMTLHCRARLCAGRILLLGSSCDLALACTTLRGPTTTFVELV